MTDHIATLEEVAKECRAHARVSEQAHMPGVAEDFRDVGAKISAAIALMRGQSWQVVGYMDPDADFMLPRDGGCVLSTQLILVCTPTERYSRPVYLPTPPKDTADEQ